MIETANASPCPRRGMCAVRKHLKHMGRMDPSYPVHVQRRHACDRRIHLIHKIFRCCGGRFRRCGVKSANQTHELPRNCGISPSPWGKKYLDPLSTHSISITYEQRPGLRGPLPEACAPWGFRGCPGGAGRSGQGREAVRRGRVEPEEEPKIPHRAFVQGQNAPVRATRAARTSAARSRSPSSSAARARRPRASSMVVAGGSRSST